MAVSEPDVLPLLGRGRHRTPRTGACFMELAGYLAGERWGDHPACTHPLLARLARGVNDATSDDARPRLATLVPSVIGLTSADPAWDHVIAVVAAAAALPVAPEERQRALAVGLLTCERLLADADADADRGPEVDRAIAGVLDRAGHALDDVPLAARWGRRFAAEHGGGRLVRHPGTAIVDFSVQGIAWSSHADVDGVLRGLLADAVEVCRSLAGRADQEAPSLTADAWPPTLAAAAVG